MGDFHISIFVSVLNDEKLDYWICYKLNMPKKICLMGVVHWVLCYSHPFARFLRETKALMKVQTLVWYPWCITPLHQRGYCIASRNNYSSQGSWPIGGNEGIWFLNCDSHQERHHVELTQLKMFWTSLTNQNAKLRFFFFPIENRKKNWAHVNFPYQKFFSCGKCVFSWRII